jgi:hypothetical protein
VRRCRDSIERAVVDALRKLGLLPPAPPPARPLRIVPTAD